MDPFRIENDTRSTARTLPKVFEISSTTFKDGVYSLLHELRTDLFWYRKDLLQKEGLAMPRTWDEVGTAAAKLNKDRLIGYASILVRQRRGRYGARLVAEDDRLDVRGDLEQVGERFSGLHGRRP